MVLPALQGLLESARLHGRVDSTEFARIVLPSAESLAKLAGVNVAELRESPDTPAIQDFLLAATAVLAEAKAINEDEACVIRWFNLGELRDFDLRTLAQVIASGRGAALLEYLRALGAGFSG